MVKKEVLNKYLEMLCDFIVGLEQRELINYEQMTINYNENGDTYYLLDAYSNGKLKGVQICACEVVNGKKKKVCREIYMSEFDSFENLMEFIVRHSEEIELYLDKCF